MKTTLSCHQPNFLPYLGYIYKMSKSDIFVFLDDVQFEKNLYQNRVKIKTPKGEKWLTCPIHFSSKMPINQVTLANWKEERGRVLKTIEMNYSKSPLFDNYFYEIYDIMNRDWKTMAGLNSVLIMWLASKWELKTKFEFSSENNFGGDGDDRIINICKHFDSDYLSGISGKEYMEEDKFKRNGVGLQYSDFVHPTYKQQWGNFIPNLSAIDVLFNEGPIKLNGGSI